MIQSSLSNHSWQLLEQDNVLQIKSSFGGSLLSTTYLKITNNMGNQCFIVFGGSENNLINDFSGTNIGANKSYQICKQ